MHINKILKAHLNIKILFELLSNNKRIYESIFKIFTLLN